MITLVYLCHTKPPSSQLHIRRHTDQSRDYRQRCLSSVQNIVVHSLNHTNPLCILQVKENVSFMYIEKSIYIYWPRRLTSFIWMIFIPLWHLLCNFTNDLKLFEKWTMPNHVLAHVTPAPLGMPGPTSFDRLM